MRVSTNVVRVGWAGSKTMPRRGSETIARAHVARLIVLTVVAVLVSGSSAQADDPRDAMNNAIRDTAKARTAKLAIKQQVTTRGRTTEIITTGTAVSGDHDLVTTGETGPARVVAVGTRVKERWPNDNTQAWREHTRAAPTQTSALGPLTLKDGTVVGDPRLYTSVADAGTETIASVSTRKIVGQLSLAAVATAMQVSGADATRMAQWSGTLTVWIAPDGRVARNVVHLVIPSASGPTTIDAQIDLSDLDAPLMVTLP